ncbi:MAG: succinate dehydrogenase assembly factor 2 [Alphaproteobacteria bacterium]|tara:strand:- start:826 stop:1086 length:261 start_codon:yes stop_codon:yes gene_type:complete
MEKNTEIIRKKILFRSWHRGTKEMDLVLGTYADNNLSNMSYDELLHFQSFLNLSDPDLYKWLISEEKAFPEEFRDLIEDIILKTNS